MVYRDFKGLKLSSLGLGTMRLPKLESGKIDRGQVAEMVEYALSNGINYFDTAYMYHDGESELAVGEALKKYPRESFYLADKFPGFSHDNMLRKEEIFEDQLKKCQVEYFDFYLFHNVSERNVEDYMDDEIGIMEYLKAQKAAGRIRHIGCSAHAQFDTLKRFLDKYKDDIEFCQLQVNWFDWTYEEAEKRVNLLREYGIPLWVMEPLRGGKLVNLGKKYEDKLKALRPDETLPAWSFRFLENCGATMVLSGMSDMNQLKDNIVTFSSMRPLNNEEWKALQDISFDMQNSNMVHCTSCRYCTTVCPIGLDIPKIIEIYNGACFTGAGKVPQRALGRLEEGKRPTDCLGCQACEGICPQNIPVSEIMKKLCE